MAEGGSLHTSGGYKEGSPLQIMSSSWWVSPCPRGSDMGGMEWDAGGGLRGLVYRSSCCHTQARSVLPCICPLPLIFNYDRFILILPFLLPPKAPPKPMSEAAACCATAISSASHRTMTTSAHVTGTVPSTHNRPTPSKLASESKSLSDRAVSTVMTKLLQHATLHIHFLKEVSS